MPETSDKSELKGEKDNLKRKSSGSRSEHIEANVRIIERGDGADGAKTDSHGLQELAATLRQGFTQMSQDLSKTIAESFKQFQSDFEIQYVWFISGSMTLIIKHEPFQFVWPIS